MLMQQKTKMTKTVTTTDFTMILDSSDVLHVCSAPMTGSYGLVAGIAGVTF